LRFRLGFRRPGTASSDVEFRVWVNTRRWNPPPVRGGDDDASGGFIPPCRGRARASWARGRQRRQPPMRSLRTAGCFRRGGGGLAEVAGVLAVRRVPRPELVLLKQPRFGYYLQNNRDPINCFTHSHLVLIVID